MQPKYCHEYSSLSVLEQFLICSICTLLLYWFWATELVDRIVSQNKAFCRILAESNLFCCFHSQDKNAQKLGLRATTGDGCGVGDICAPGNVHGWKWARSSRVLLTVVLGAEPLAPLVL